MRYLITFPSDPKRPAIARRTAPQAMSAANDVFGENTHDMVIMTPKGRRITFLQLATLVQDGFLA